MRFLDAGPRIGKLDDHVGPVAQRPHVQHTVADFFHGVNGVTDDVEEDLQQLVRVSAHTRQNRFGPQLDGDFSPA